jgi:hypothetical protein
MSLAVCLAFYSPCDYALPRRHLAATLEWLAGEGVEVVLAQVVKRGQAPQPVPSGIKSLVYESDCVMFFKENLLNIAAAEAKADKLLFMDADLRFTAADALDQTATLLDRVDVCQPFGTAVWHTQDGKVSHARRGAAFALSKGYEPTTRYYHPGFAWGMTRRAFDFLGGLFEAHPLGGGDIAFAYSLDPRFVGVDLRAKMPHDAHFWTSPSYEAYRHRGVSLALRVGCLDTVDCIHSWHGDVAHRQYTSRGDFLPVEPGREYPLHKRPDGLLEWDDPRYSEQVLAYFTSRREDG